MISFSASRLALSTSMNSGLPVSVTVLVGWLLPSNSVRMTRWSCQIALRSTGLSRLGRVSSTPGPRATIVALSFTLPSSKIVASIVRIVVTEPGLPLLGPSTAAVSTFSTQSLVLLSPRR